MQQNASSHLPPAVENAPRSTEWCVNHPGIPAQWRCTDCGRGFCGSCVREMRVHTSTAQVCNQCGGMCIPFVSESEAATATGRYKSFWHWLPTFLAYPLRGEGLYILLVGTIVFSIVELIATFMIFAIVVASIIAGFLCKYYVKVIRLSARGIDVPPSWGEIDTADMGDFLRQFLRTAAVAVFYAAFPVLYYLFVSDGETDPIFWLLIGLAVFAYPMALLAVLYYEDVLEVNPYTVLRSIFRVPSRYGAILIAIAISTALSILLHSGIQTALQHHDFKPLVLTAVFFHRFVSLYFYTAIMHLLGVLVLTSKTRLGWV